MAKKVIIVTGASSGFGKDTVKKFLSEGNIVYAGARRVEKMRDIEKAGAKVIKLDITEDESVDAFVETVLKNHGKI
ncbi:SDR family NAD(P)-dependent oxidoreductase [Acidaminobacter sp. JC074]|uniref:SDR family NAD(P)-dependent oxidoreductase n=1 Tax=Acidaminobacter sp. JC074 TaxID=2530199 RepID=UPI001F0FEC20|nr:SDR family NAD(P)-dependent oxidoreductase [Acidaminobacter sp. JC074]MCH4889420.1 SDR family NAD(P)-dependent oxidoreductase [Acidaminobacter sp. JC074]